MDKLEEIFKLQKTLQERLMPEKIKVICDDEYFKLNILAVEDELHEALRETPWKPWKKQQTLNIDNVQKELIDALHFFINLCISSGMTADDVYNKYIEKNHQNHQRQQNGY